MFRTVFVVFALCAAMLAGHAVADNYPAGCVDCHVKTPERDFRINTILAQTGHGRAGERSKVIPDGCTRCHASDNEGPASSIRTLIHSIHYEIPSKNPFVTQYGSDCRHCHSMDISSGKVSVKSGERNWELAIVSSD